MAIQSGTAYRWAVGDESSNTVIAKATGGTLDITHDTIEVVHKDNASGTTAWTAKDYGNKSWSGTCDLYKEETDTSWETIYDAIVGDTKLNVIVTDATSGNTYHKGSAVITNYTENFEVNELVSISVTFEGDGALTKGTLA